MVDIRICLAAAALFSRADSRTARPDFGEILWKNIQKKRMSQQTVKGLDGKIYFYGQSRREELLLRGEKGDGEPAANLRGDPLDTGIKNDGAKRTLLRRWCARRDLNPHVRNGH